MNAELGNRKNTSIDEEVDLISLLVRLVKVVRKRFYLLIIFLVINAILGSLAYFAFRPVYTTKMILESNVVRYANIANLVETLQDLVEEQNFVALQERLNISNTLAQDIKSLRAINITEKVLGRADREDIEDYQVIIEAEVRSNRVLDSLQIGLLHYLENNQYINERIQEYKENTETELRKVSSDISQLDSLKKSVEELIRQENLQNLYLADVGDMYENSLRLYEKESYLKTRLRFIGNIQVIEGFTQFREPSSFNLTNSIIAGAASGFVLWIFAVLYLETRLLVNRAMEKEE